MFINLTADQNLAVTFNFNQQIVEAVRTIPGRRFDAKRKRWLVPADNIVECIKTLQPLGFRINTEVSALLRQKEAEISAVEMAKTGLGYANDDKLPLYSFQRKGACFLSNSPVSLLADVPGLGKTLQTIAALHKTKNILVFCPASLKFSWAEEIEKWTKQKATVINGKKDERKAQWEDHERWTIANYELLLRDFDEINDQDWEAIVCDEATRISNPQAKSVRALKKIQTKKKIALTGTPVSNSPVDLYSIIDWLSPFFLGTYYQFQEKYCVIEPRFHRVVAYKNMKDLSDRVSRFTLRRTKEEVFDDFPKKTIKDIVFDLSEKEKEFYDAIRQEIVEDLGEVGFSTRTLSLIPVKMLRLKQSTCHPGLLGKKLESTKLSVLKELLEPVIRSGEKAIIFTQFAKMAKILYNELIDYGPQIIYGDIKIEDRQLAVKSFTEDKESKIIIMTEAGAYGLNLQKASYVFHYDFPWSVAKLTQREDRCHRIGQTKPVTVYNLVSRETIDEYCVKVLYKKQKTAVNLLKDDERLTKLGLAVDDIKAILRI